MTSIQLRTAALVAVCMSVLLVLGGVVLVIVLALFFDFTNGFHDTANAMATPIATGALKPKVAVMLAASLNLVGAFHVLRETKLPPIDRLRAAGAAEIGSDDQALQDASTTVHGHALTTVETLYFDESRERVGALRETRYEDLVLESVEVQEFDAAAARELLLAHAAADQTGPEAGRAQAVEHLQRVRTDLRAGYDVFGAGNDDGMVGAVIFQRRRSLNKSLVRRIKVRIIRPACRQRQFRPRSHRLEA